MTLDPQAQAETQAETKTDVKAAPAGSPAFIAPVTGDKFACVVAGKVIGVSKHQDYFKLHYKKRDVKVLLDKIIDKFVYLDDTGGIAAVVDLNGAQVNKVGGLRKRALAAAQLARA